MTRIEIEENPSNRAKCRQCGTLIQETHRVRINAGANRYGNPNILLYHIHCVADVVCNNLPRRTK